MKAIIHGQAVTNRLINNTRPYIVTTLSFQSIKDALYNVINTSSTIPGAGQLLIPPSGLTIRISEWDSNAVNHYAAISTLTTGDIINIGSASCTLSAAPIWNTDYFSIFVVALPVVADGEYAVTVTLAPPAETPPENITQPTIAGATTVGSTLTCTPGTYNGNPTPTLTRQWYRDTATIGGQTGLTYVTVLADNGFPITIKETATNTDGNLTLTSNAITVTVEAPQNTVEPYLTNPVIVGSTVTCETGTWTGTDPITYTYQWRLEGANISGATSNTYTPITTDNGKGIDCVVTATNAGGNASANSNLDYVGTSYLYFNTPATDPQSGQMYVGSGSTTIRFNNVDVDGTDHSVGLGTVVPTDIITVGTQSANILTSTPRSGYHEVTVDAWPALPDAHYPAKIEHVESGNPEIIVNGTFDTNIDGWKLYDTVGTLSWDAGVLKVDGGNGNSGAQSETNVTVEVGKTYRVKATWARGTFDARTSLRFYMGHTAGNFHLGNDFNQWQSDTDLVVDATFVATRTVLYVLFATNAINQITKYSTIDNVSLKEEPL